ncbi:hypothetical protein Tco_0680390 [Tanacetum coccineum]|uniref:Reverse transcriptase domain-containing protein n=1 Tax=Tanacetum coccineum TaxID=301880 RepID=A0ABQ4XLC4_9ASTR
MISSQINIGITSKRENCNAKFSIVILDTYRCNFFGQSHSIIRGLHVDPAKIEAVKNWTSPTTPTEDQSVVAVFAFKSKRNESKTPERLFLSDESLVIPMKELQLDDKLNFVEEPVEVMDREIKQLKRSRIPIIKVRWNSKRGPEFTWEREDEIRAKYPHLFSIITSSSIKSRDEISVRGGDYNNPQFS